MLSHRGVIEMKWKPFGVLVCAACLLSIFVLCDRSMAQQPADTKPAVNPLVRVLQAKGILTAEEVAQISQASSAIDADQRLAKLLLMKGVISQADYDQTVSAMGMMNASGANVSNTTATAAVYRVPASTGATVASVSNAAAPAGLPSDQAASTGPLFIPAITPVRTLPVGPLPRETGNIGFKIGSVRVTPYGFIKATAIHDSSSPNGDDFPLPGFIAADTGPNGAPEFHVKARSSRIGTNLEWLDPSSNFTITGKFEADFEGNFSRADNRNISTARSSMLGIRLAFARIDYKFSDTDSVNLVFGQDWTPFASSTLPNLLETTGLGLAFGTLYERAPQMRAGWTHDFGGFKLMPEVAMVFPLFGDDPSAANLANQLGYGERQGSDSDHPGVEARIVGQFQLDHAPGVAPAQLILSGEHQQRTAVVLASAVPALAATNPLGVDFFKDAFPHGATVSSDSNGWTGEFQLPTRYATLIGKFYSGSDLRFFFAGQFFSNFTDEFGLTNIQPGVTSVDGASSVIFATNSACTVPTPACTAVIAPERPVRAEGGFVNLGLPLSRIFGADPQGRNMGWSVYFHYGVDFAKDRDLMRFSPDGNRHKSPMYAATLYYKLNNWVTFAFEQSLYETDAIPGPTGILPLFNGIPSRTWRDLRSEGGTIFTF
jgi:hypothetical protein